MVAIGSKLSTKAYGNSQGRQTASINEGPQLQSTQDFEKLGGRDVGEILNKVADSNWIDPSKKMRTAGKADIDKDAFFKLMLAQLKNQDPMNPMQSHEMAAQLAQFSSLEQMQNINATLTEMRSAQRPLENFQSLSLIGKSVDGDTAKIIRGPKDASHDFKFQLPRDASAVTVRVRDADGNVVRTYELQGAKSGENKISWNGEDESGRKVGPGDYQFFAEAKDGSDNKIPITTEFNGIISGVSFGAGGVVLHVGSQTIRMADVKKISDPVVSKMSDETSADSEAHPENAVSGVPSPQAHPESSVAGLGDGNQSKGSGKKDQNGIHPAQLDLRKQEGKVDNQNKGAPQAMKAAVVSTPQMAPPKSKVMDSVGLSREMMNKVTKELKPEVNGEAQANGEKKNSSKPESGKKAEVAATNKPQQERLRNRVDDNIVL